MAHGSPNLAQKLLRRLRRRDGFVQCSTDGFRIIVHLSDDVGRLVYFGSFEREEVRFLSANVKPGDVCFDVGANIGYFSLLMASLGASVYAFEPVPLNFHLLSANAHLNSFTNIRAYQAAVGEFAGSLQFTVATDSAYSSFIDTGRKPVASVISVDVVTLDDFCEHNEIHRIDCLKVDVEGAEPRVLAGAQRLLSDPTRRPRVMVLELFNPMLKTYGNDIASIVRSLSAYGYKALVEHRKGELLPITEADYDIRYNVFFESH